MLSLLALRVEWGEWAMDIVPLKLIEYGIYGDLSRTYPKPYSIYLRGSIILRAVKTSPGAPGAPTPPK